MFRPILIGWCRGASLVAALFILIIPSNIADAKVISRAEAARRGSTSVRNQNGKSGKKSKPVVVRDYEHEAKLTTNYEDPEGRFVLELPSGLTHVEPSGDATTSTAAVTIFDSKSPTFRMEIEAVSGPQPEFKLTGDPFWLGATEKNAQNVPLLQNELDRMWLRDPEVTQVSEVAPYEINQNRGGPFFMSVAKITRADGSEHWGIRAIFALEGARGQVTATAKSHETALKVKKLIWSMLSSAQILKPRKKASEREDRCVKSAPLVVPAQLEVDPDAKSERFAYRPQIDQDGVCEFFGRVVQRSLPNELNAETSGTFDWKPWLRAGEVVKKVTYQRQKAAETSTAERIELEVEADAGKRKLTIVRDPRDSKRSIVAYFAAGELVATKCEELFAVALDYPDGLKEAPASCSFRKRVKP